MGELSGRVTGAFPAMGRRASLNLDLRPGESEFAHFYASYIALAPDGDILETLEREGRDAIKLLRDIPEARGAHRYAAGKWSIRELVGHLIDAERIFSVRALRFSRGDPTPLPGFEQDDYIAGASFDDFALGELTDEFEAVRRSTVLLFRHLTGEAWLRRGTASGAEVSVRALAWIIAGHELHHRGILRTRYLKTA